MPVWLGRQRPSMFLVHTNNVHLHPRYTHTTSIYLPGTNRWVERGAYVDVGGEVFRIRQRDFDWLGTLLRERHRVCRGCLSQSGFRGECWEMFGLSAFRKASIPRNSCTNPGILNPKSKKWLQHPAKIEDHQRGILTGLAPSLESAIECAAVACRQTTR